MRIMAGSKPEQPDSPPKQLYIGAINPFALVEAILGRKLDWGRPSTAQILASILQTDYEELFDMRFHSILYAGTRLNEHGDKAELIPAKEMHTLTERDLVTPDFSKVEKLGDLGHMGLKDLESIRVKHAVVSNGNLRVTLEPNSLGKTLSNSQMTTTFRELSTPFRIDKEAEWTPPNGIWTNTEACYYQSSNSFSNPVQGAIANSWLIAALMSVAWSDPSVIKHCAARLTPATTASELCCGPKIRAIPSHDDKSSKECELSIKFYSKGGDRDAHTRTVTVNCELPINKSSSTLMYCRPSFMNAAPAPFPHVVGAWGGDLWPALYEKAFAKWITEENHHQGRDREREQHPDLTQTAYGDPVKAMAQLTDREPQYFGTHSRSAHDLLGLVRAHSVNQRTAYPTVAWTRPSHPAFRGCTLVGNVAYTILGWAAPQERKQYVVLRHPWGLAGVPAPPTNIAPNELFEVGGIGGIGGCGASLAGSYFPGGVVFGGVDEKFWAPAALLDNHGVFAVEAEAFKEYFAGLGIAK